MKRTLLFYCFIAILGKSSFAQEQKLTQNIFRINLINPAIEYEQAIFKNSIYTTRLGWGLSAPYPNLESGTLQSGWAYMLTPYINSEYKWLYNLQRRSKMDKNTQQNSGNYVGCRLEYRGKATNTNIARIADNDFSIGPMWGVQRALGKLNLLIDVGGIYYLDTKGNNGIIYSIHLRLGLNLSKTK